MLVCTIYLVSQLLVFSLFFLSQPAATGFLDLLHTKPQFVCYPDRPQSKDEHCPQMLSNHLK